MYNLTIYILTTPLLSIHCLWNIVFIYSHYHLKTINCVS